jgi:serine/threonine-protein kinase RsbT
VHGGGGAAQIEQVTNARGKPGVRVSFTDSGPGIPDVNLALTDGWTTGGGMGLGLSGARRLVDEFSLTTEAGAGTTVVMTKWAR